MILLFQDKKKYKLFCGPHIKKCQILQKNLKNIIIKGYEGIAGVLKAIKNSDSNKIITDIRTLSISKNRTIESIENKDYDADQIHQNIKHSFESKNQTIKSIKNKG